MLLTSLSGLPTRQALREERLEAFLPRSALSTVVVAGAASRVPRASAARLDSGVSAGFLPAPFGAGRYGHVHAPWISEPGVQWQVFGQVNA